MTDVAGRWRIVEMELWDRDDLDLVGPAFIEFDEDRTGRFAFIASRVRSTPAMRLTMAVRVLSSRGRTTARATRLVAGT